jgi:hypothetical protein
VLIPSRPSGPTPAQPVADGHVPPTETPARASDTCSGGQPVGQNNRLFRDEFPAARAYCLHASTRRWHESGIEIMPVAAALTDLDAILA